MAIPQLDSRIEKAKVYSAGATVTRVAQLALTAENAPESVEIPGLPLALDDSSVRVRVEVDGGGAILACDIRVGLAVTTPQAIANAPTDEEILASELVVRQLQDLIVLLEHEISLLNNLEIPNRPKGEPGKAPPPSPTSARKTIANFCDEQIRSSLKQKRDNLEKLRFAEENLADLKQKQRLASSAKEAKQDELRKTIIVSLNYSDTPLNNARLILEYFVPGARWTPTYICRLNSRESTASIAVRAFINQYTGEDWSGVRLELSTANPISWCALPE